MKQRQASHSRPVMIVIAKARVSPIPAPFIREEEQRISLGDAHVED